MDEHVALIRIDHQLGRHVKCGKCMPPFDGLLHRNFTVAVSYKNQGWSLDRVDEVHRITFSVDCMIVVYGRADERNHPLVNVVETIVAEPVGETCACDCRGEALRLSFSPHRHVAAVAVPANTDALRVDRILPGHCIDASHNVAEVAASKILHISLGEGLALSVAAARVGAQGKVA